MDDITILRNPDPKYFEDIVEYVVTQEGWINSVHDYKTFSDAFPGENFILLVAVDSETQEFIGSICVATYLKPEPLSAIGMYVVKKEFQGKGIGTKLFDEAMRLSAKKKFLYGVADMVPRYRDKFGFDKMPDWHLVSAHSDIRKVKPLQLNHDPTLIIQTPAACGWDEIAKYYQKFLPQLDGSELIKALLCEPQSHCGVAVTNEKRIVALVRVRETFNSELSIGPLLGNDLIAACTVLRHVLSRIQNLREFKTLSIQFPNTNTDVRDFMQQLTDGEYKIGQLKTYPQFTDEIFELPTHHIYAISQNDISIV